MQGTTLFNCLKFGDHYKVTLTAAPAAGSAFAGWSGCAPVAANPKQCTVTMSTDQTATATFAPAGSY